MNNMAENIIPFLKRPNDTLHILIVEDDRMQRIFLETQVGEQGYRVTSVENGMEALNYLRENNASADIVLMDRMMPVMDGLSAIRHMRDDKNLKNIPVIMVTGASSLQDMREGIDAGVFYYLTKPVHEDVLRSVLLAASREIMQRQNLKQEMLHYTPSLDSLQTAKFNLRTLSEAENLSSFLSQFYPDPERTLPGIAEILINAVEHGNLEIGYTKKTELLENGTWHAEIEKRLEDNSFRNRTVDVVLARKEDGLYLVITDEGAGFKWQPFMMIDPSRAGDSHGRGIAQARAMSFDKLTYNEQGNQAVAFVGFEKRLDW